MNLIDSVKANSGQLSEKESVQKKLKGRVSKNKKKEPKIKGTLDEIFGLWKNRDIELDEIREQQWVRKPE